MVSADGDLDLSGAPNIEVLPNPGARGGLGLNKAHFTSVSGKLFPNNPATGDIKQQQIGPREREIRAEHEIEIAAMARRQHDFRATGYGTSRALE